MWDTWGLGQSFWKLEQKDPLENLSARISQNLTRGNTKKKSTNVKRNDLDKLSIRNEEWMRKVKMICWSRAPTLEKHRKLSTDGREQKTTLSLRMKCLNNTDHLLLNQERRP